MNKSIKDLVLTQGSADMLTQDSNNCTVLALSATKGMSYDAAYRIAKHFWTRVHGKGVSILKLMDYFKNTSTPKIDTINVYHTKWNNKDVRCRMNLSTFSKRYDKGSYYVVVGHHALAVIDGKIIDHGSNIQKTRRVVKHAWKIK